MKYAGLCNFRYWVTGFVPTYQKGTKGKYQIIVSEKKWRTLKQGLKLITKKTAPDTIDERMAKLRELYRGWINYFRMASMQTKLKELDGWLRNRLRYCIWEDWKKPERKRKNLIRLGIPTGQAYAWSRTRMARWAVAQSPILITTITLKRLTKRGYESMSRTTNKCLHACVPKHFGAQAQLKEPLYTRPAWPALRNRRVQWSYLR